MAVEKGAAAAQSFVDVSGQNRLLIFEELMADWSGDAASLATFENRVLANPLYLNTLLSRDHAFTALTIRPHTYSSLVEAAELEGFEVDGDPEPIYLTSKELGELLDVLDVVVARHRAPDFRLYPVGGWVMGKRIDTIARHDVMLFTTLSVGAIGLFLLLLFRRVTAAVLPLLVVTLSALATFGAMGHLGIPFTAVSQVLPSFFIAVGVCDSVHILAIAYRRLAEGAERQEAIVYALEHSGLAVVLTSVTTAGGLASFLTAEIFPVAQLGVAAPLGVLMALAYTLTLLPGLLAVVPLSPARRGGYRGVAGPVDAILARLGDVSINHPKSVLLTTAVVLAVGFFGVRELRFSSDFLALLFEDDPVRIAMEVVDEKFEGIASVEVLIDSGRENGLHDPDLLRRIESAMAYAVSFDDGPVTVGKATSIVDVVKEINQALHENRPEHYALPSDRRLIAQELLLFENSGSDDLSDVTDSRFQEARLTIRGTWTDGIHYVPFLEEFEAGIREILGDALEIEITGGTALAARTFSVLLTSMVRSYALALLIITPIMILLIGDLRRGMLAMIPNLIPVYLTLALMGWLDISMNMSTLIVGSIVIGLAVDDTIHFMHKFNRYYESTGDASEAVRRTFATTGTALFVTSLVLSTSFFLFIFSDFYGLVHFGILAGCATIMAFLADVLVAPALMVLATQGGGRRSIGVARTVSQLP